MWWLGRKDEIKKEIFFFLILDVFIAFERCFVRSIKEHLSVLFPPDSSPTVNLFLNYQQKPGEFHGNGDTEI